MQSDCVKNEINIPLKLDFFGFSIKIWVIFYTLKWFPDIPYFKSYIIGYDKNILKYVNKDFLTFNIVYSNKTFLCLNCVKKL